jgi:hypothetical protein
VEVGPKAIGRPEERLFDAIRIANDLGKFFRSDTVLGKMLVIFAVPDELIPRHGTSPYHK